MVFIVSLSTRGQELEPLGYSVRALGMGNAFTTVVDSDEALFYNPAGLSRVSGFYLKLLDPYVGVNGEEALTAAQSLSQSNGDIGAVIQSLNNNSVWAGFGGKASFTMDNFAIALYDQAVLSMYIPDPIFPTLNMRYTNDYGIATGFSMLAGPGLSIGFGIRSIQRTGGDVPIGLDTLASATSSELTALLNKKGRGYGIDIGFLWEIDTPIKPKLAYTFKNAGGVTFSDDSGSNNPPPSIDGQQTIGMGLEFDIGAGDILVALDYNFWNDTSIELGKKVNIGIEFDLPLIQARAGLHQGYYTLGATMDLAVLQLDVATYGVEQGVTPGQIEDRRYVLQLTMELGFDPQFSFSSFGSGSINRKRLKQRR